ncbi:MAG: DUF3021 domain-containing protein, partial [Clostridia bacterium]|nr:DUF3021 domain-containing protein [Clostridia bacterium]
MNRYIKSFFIRGLTFGGFGPIILGIVYLILYCSIENFSVNGKDIFFGILTTYLIAFVHAGASVFNEIESWSVPKSMLFNFITIYIVYTLGYILNSWLEFSVKVLLIYTLCFIVAYLTIWLVVVLSIKL